MTESREPFYGPLFGIFQLGLIVAMIPGIPRIAQYALFSTILWIAYYLVTKTTTGDPPVDLAQGSAIATQLMTLADSVFFADPDSLKDIYHGQTGKITEAPLKQRMKWALNLYINPRGIGWAHEAPHTPPRVPLSTSRSSFVFRQLRRAVICISLECAAYTLNASNPFMTDKTLLLRNAPFKWRALGTAGFALAGYARINWMHCFLSATIVGIGFSIPERWPNLFGSFTSATTVRLVWRYAWHHLLRKPIKALATFATTTIFRMRSQPTLGFWGAVQNLIWLCTAFFITGAVHIAGESMLIGRVGYGAFIFFMAQPLGIAIETLVVFVWQSFVTSISTQAQDHKKDYHQRTQTNRSLTPNVSSSAVGRRPPMWGMMVGYLWVALWFSWSLAFMIDPMIQTGMFMDPRVDFRNWVGPFSKLGLRV